MQRSNSWVLQCIASEVLHASNSSAIFIKAPLSKTTYCSPPYTSALISKARVRACSLLHPQPVHQHFHLPFPILLSSLPFCFCLCPFPTSSVLFLCRQYLPCQYQQHPSEVSFTTMNKGTRIVCDLTIISKRRQEVAVLMMM